MITALGFGTGAALILAFVWIVAEQRGFSKGFRIGRQATDTNSFDAGYMAGIASSEIARREA